MNAILTQLKAAVHQNPLARREYVSRARSRSRWFWRVAYGITAFLLLAPFLWGFSATFPRTLTDVLGFLLMMNVIAFPLVVIRTISTANQSMVDERTGKTWELLMLTGVGSWRLILGKWLGTMRFMLRDYVWLFALRGGVLVWGIAHINMTDIYGGSVMYRRTESSVTVLDMSIAHEMFVPVLLLIAGFLVLELMLSSALGIATGIFDWSRRAGNWTAILMRVGVPIVFTLGLLYAFGLISFAPNYQASYDSITLSFLSALVPILGDNASFGNVLLIDTYYSGDYSVSDMRLMVLVGQSIGAGLYLLWTALALGAAAFFLRRQGIAVDSLPGSAGTGKPKRKARPPQSAAPVPQRAERRIRAADGVQNALGLDAPQGYRVELLQYQRRTGRLYLRLTQGNQTRYVQFSSVAYVDAPMQWTGANLRTATADERDRFITAHDMKLNSLTADTIRLYQTGSEAAPVHVLAGTVTLLDDAPQAV